MSDTQSRRIIAYVLVNYLYFDLSLFAHICIHFVYLQWKLIIFFFRMTSDIRYNYFFKHFVAGSKWKIMNESRQTLFPIFSDILADRMLQLQGFMIFGINLNSFNGKTFFEYFCQMNLVRHWSLVLIVHASVSSYYSKINILSQ